jgi:hypothetical protein
LQIAAVIGEGRRFVENGKISFTAQFLHSSNRKVILYGSKAS